MGMNNKKVIIAIVGQSASGKSYLARQLEEKGIPQVVDYTTRPKRDGEHSIHQFISREMFCEYNDDFVCSSSYGGYEYGTSDSNISELCTYVIDEKGLQDLYDTNDYVIIPIFVKCSLLKRFRRGGIKRILRDLFKTYELEYDITIESEKYNLDRDIIIPICRLCAWRSNDTWKKFNLI